jgi:hypothetical protein
MSDVAPAGAEPPSKNALKKAQKEKEKVIRDFYASNGPC